MVFDIEHSYWKSILTEVHPVSVAASGLSSAIQLRIDSYQTAQACPWKFHQAVYANT